MTRDNASTYTTGQLYDWINDTYEALRGFEIMLSPFLREYSNADDFSYGITGILRHQIEDLLEVKSHIFDRIKALEERPDQQSARHGLPDDMVILPAYRPGMEHELRAKAAAPAGPLDRQEPTATELREAMIATQLRDGVEPGIIAQALNLRKSAVDKVAARLTAEAQDAPPATKAG